MKLLLDECLSPDLVGLARARGRLESTHATWIGLRAAKDWRVLERAVRDDWTLVTNDAMDFRRLYRRQTLHAGLICLTALGQAVSLDLQRGLFGLALDALDRDGDLVNAVLEVVLDRGSVRIARYEWPQV